ncbi:MAG: radical SAM-associated putative lipoprotein [Tannerella sp.]|jgi:putative lipoprotein (rSAM/lipoprotein system)|nr:radical SAM-associated putative lipoprotein [Tannerella sp.]
MKKLNRKFVRGTNWALAGLMSFLGFSSCEENNTVEYGVPYLEYGTPYAEFIVSGKVTDTKGNGLQGIQVVIPGVDHHQRATSGFIPSYPVISVDIKDTLYTKEGGNFNYSYNGFPSNDSINIKMKFEDISENPRFETDSAKISFFSSDLQNGSGWYEGKAEKEIKIGLKDKESE